MQKGRQDPRARATDGMAQGDCAAQRIHLGQVKSQDLDQPISWCMCSNRSTTLLTCSLAFMTAAKASFISQIDI